MFDIHQVMTELSKTRPIFHSEADFQHALAWQIHEIIPDCRIRLEFNSPYQEGVYLDIWIPNQQTVVELKYKTKALWALDNRELFFLKEQGAQNHGRYDFLKDIERVEREIELSNSVNRGFAVILTNEPSYSREGSLKRGSNHYDFRIHEGRVVTGELAWLDPTAGGAKKRQEPINLKGSYDLRWQDYSEIPELPENLEIPLMYQGKHRQFRYLAVAVGG